MQKICLSAHFFFCSVDDCVYLVGDFIGGELDVIHEGLLGFVAADMHHLDDGEFVGEVHVGYTAAPCGVGGNCFIVSFVGTLTARVGTVSESVFRISLI